MVGMQHEYNKTKRMGARGVEMGSGRVIPVRRILMRFSRC